MPINCFTIAISNFISQNLGAKEYDRAKEGARFGIITSVLMSIVIGLILYALIPYISRFFSKNPEVNEYTIKAMRTTSLFFAFLAFSHCISSVCRGSGKAIVPMFVMLSIWCIFRVIYITVAMMINHNIILLYCAYPLTWFLSTIVFLIYYLKSDWIHGLDNKVND